MDGKNSRSYPYNHYINADNCRDEALEFDPNKTTGSEGRVKFTYQEYCEGLKRNPPIRYLAKTESPSGEESRYQRTGDSLENRILADSRHERLENRNSRLESRSGARETSLNRLIDDRHTKLESRSREVIPNRYNTRDDRHTSRNRDGRNGRSKSRTRKCKPERRDDSIQDDRRFNTRRAPSSDNRLRVYEFDMNPDTRSNYGQPLSQQRYPFPGYGMPQTSYRPQYNYDMSSPYSSNISQMTQPSPYSAVPRHSEFGSNPINPYLDMPPPPMSVPFHMEPPQPYPAPHLYGSQHFTTNTSTNASIANLPQNTFPRPNYHPIKHEKVSPRGRSRGQGEGQSRGNSQGPKSRRTQINTVQDKDEVKPIVSDVQSLETASKYEKKETFLFFIFKNKSDESFDYVAYLKSRTESLKSVEYDIQGFLKTGNSKVILASFPSKSSANKITKLFKKTNSSSDVEVLCYLNDFLPSAYQDLARVNLGKKKTAPSETIEEQTDSKKKKKKKTKKPDTHETTLYLRINGALESSDSENFVKVRMGMNFPYQFQLVSSTLSENGSTTNVEIKVPSEEIADIVIRQLEKSNTNSSTKIICSLIPVTNNGNSKDITLKLLSDITTKSKQRMEHHEIKITEASKRFEEFVINSHVSIEQYKRKVAMKEAIRTKLEELRSQSGEFLKRIEKLKAGAHKLGNDETFQIQQLSKLFSIECCRLDTALPIYARRSDILSCIANNQVIILRGATGSGKSTQIAQYLLESDLLKDKMVVCTQPRKVACVSLATRVSEELLLKLGKTVGYRTGLKQRASKDTKIIFMTDHTLLNECLKDPLFSNYSVIIIDEAHERSIYTDLLLGIVKKCLPQRPDLKVIISSATIDIQVFTNYFQSSKAIEVAGRTFPVEVVWKPEAEQSSDNYEDEAVKLAIQVHKDEGPGDILVFMTTPLETEKCKERLEAKLGKGNGNFKCLSLHGQLNIQEQQLVFQPLPENQRKIVFATNTAETSITIPGVKYVIDTGLAKEMNFDAKRNINCLAVNIISQSSAEQRKGRAGRTSPGKCYRLYTEQTFLDMKKSNVPEILRVHLGQALLKLLQFGINPSECNFVESPSQDALDSALKTLVQINAVEDGKITEHGNWLAKVPFEPRLSTIVKEGFDKGFLYDALVVASLMSPGGSIFYRGGTKADKDKSDLVKTQFCQHQGDCFTLLKVYKEWIAQPEDKRNKWCFDNYVNSKVIRGVHETITEISDIMKRELGIKVEKEFSTDDNLEENIQKIILSAFSENIAHFTGHRKVGYFVPNLDQQVFIHPSSSLKVVNDTSDWVVFCNVLRTSTDFITTITPVKEEWIQEMVRLHFNIEDVKSKQISNVHTEYFGSNSFSIFVGPRFTKLRKYEEILTQICGCIVMINADRDRGEVRFYSSKFTNTARTTIAKWRDESQQVVLKKTEEFQLGSKRTRSGGVRIILGKGGEGTLLLMPLEYRSVHITKPNYQTSSKENIMEKFSRFGEIDDCWQDKKSDGRWGCVTYSTKCAAELAVQETRDDVTDVAVPEIKQFRRYDFEFKARLTWSRRATKGMAFVEVNPNILGDAIRLGSFCFNGKIVKVDLQDNSTGLILRRLPTSAKEVDIRDGLCNALGFISEEEKANIQRVSVVREKAEATSIDELDKIKGTISDSISNCMKDQSRFVVDVIKPKKDTDINFVAYANFYSAEDGHLACNGLQGALRINDQPVTMTPDISSSINISQKVYKIMKPSIDEAVKALKEETIDFKFHEKILKNGLVVLNFYSKDPSGVATSRATIEGILKGEEIECCQNENYRHFFLQQGQPVIRRIEAMTHTAINLDRRVNIMRIFGTTANIKAARMEVQNCMVDFVNRTGNEINLRELGRPRGLMKVLMKYYGLNLEKLVEDAGLQSVLLNHKTQTVKIAGESAAMETACTFIDDLSSSLLLESNYINRSHSSTSYVIDEKTPSGGDRLPECCTCLCPIDSLTEIYRLESCSHAYCLDCFGRQIEVAIQSKDLPVLCGEDDCQKPFSWVDFKTSFSKVKIEPRALVGAAVTSFMLRSGRGIYHHCLTPDCPVIYKTNTENTQYVCEECGIRICSSCHIEYHDGLSCAMYKRNELHKTQVEEYLKNRSDTIKPCPGCQTPIEKNRGCNRMICVACRTVFCWHCTAKFTSSDECYDHLNEEHGGIATLDDLLY